MEPAESASSIQISYLSSLTTPPALRRSVKPDQIVWARSQDACASSDGNVATSTGADGFTQSNHPGKTLTDVLGEIGGGVEVTLLAAAPNKVAYRSGTMPMRGTRRQGSGLRTSSILGAVLLAALERFFGVFDERHINTGELYRQVLQMEQMLTTGGGLVGACRHLLANAS